MALNAIQEARNFYNTSQQRFAGIDPWKILREKADQFFKTFAVTPSQPVRTPINQNKTPNNYKTVQPRLNQEYQQGAAQSAALNFSPSQISTKQISKPVINSSYSQQLSNFNPIQATQKAIAPYQIKAGKFLQGVQIPQIKNQLPPFLNNLLQTEASDFVIGGGIRSIGNTLVRAGKGQFAKGGVLNAVEDVGNLAFALPVGRLAGGSSSVLKRASNYLSKVADKNSINKIMDFVIDVQKTGGNKNYGELGQDVHAIASDLFGTNTKTLSNKQLANAFDYVLKEVGRGKNNFNLGLAVDDVRQGKVIEPERFDLDHFREGMTELRRIAKEGNRPEIVTNFQNAIKGKSMLEAQNLLGEALTGFRDKGGNFMLRMGKSSKPKNDWYNLKPKNITSEQPILRKNTKPGAYTNVASIDNPLVSGKDLTSIQKANTAWLDVAPAETKTLLRTSQEAGKLNETPPGRIFEDMINHDNGIDVGKKVNIVDNLLRTPNRVLEKIGLGKEAQFIRKSFESYQQQLPVELSKVTEWSKRVPKDQNAELFRYLDGQGGTLKGDTLQVANEIKSYLKTWADKLGLPEDKRITSYITHIFEKDFIAKEFDPEISALIRDKVAGSVYDPFVQQRLGKLGYKEDTWASLDAYLKRGVRKVNMDPALEKIKQASLNMEDSQFDYVKNYIDRVNMRPTKYENLVDNTIKQVAGYRFGQRPTIAISQWTRQMVYRGTLGLNPVSALKNLTQGANTYARLGTKYTIIGYTNLLKGGLKARQELQDVGVLKNDFIEDRTINATKKFWQTTDKGVFSFFEGAEYINRGAAYFGAKAQALSKGMDEAQAIEAAKKVVADTHFLFSAIDTPPVLQGPINKTLFQFQSFNLKQAEFLAEMIKNKDFAGLLRFSLASSLMYFTIGEAIGMRPQDFIPFSGVLTGQTKLGQTPPVKLLGDIGGGVFNTRGTYGEELTLQDRLKTIGNDLVPFIPAGVQAKKTIEGLKNVNQGYKTTKSGKVAFSIEQTPANYLRAGILGTNNLPEAGKYFDEGAHPQSQGETLHNSLKKLPREEANQKYKELKKKNPALARSVKQAASDEKAGVTREEKSIRSLGVADQARVQTIQDVFSKLKTEEEKKALYYRFKDIGIITPDVIKQLMQLRKEGKF